MCVCLICEVKAWDICVCMSDVWSGGVGYACVDVSCVNWVRGICACICLMCKMWAGIYGYVLIWLVNVKAWDKCMFVYVCCVRWKRGIYVSVYLMCGVMAWVGFSRQVFLGCSSWKENMGWWGCGGYSQHLALQSSLVMRSEEVASNSAIKLLIKYFKCCHVVLVLHPSALQVSIKLDTYTVFSI